MLSLIGSPYPDLAPLQNLPMLAIEFVLAASALYEIFEWLLTLMMAGPGADAYNGQQGDIRDAQKDMACATVGGLIATAMIAVRRSRR